MREALRRKVSRGHVTLSARFERDAEAEASPIDEARFAAYVAQLRGSAGALRARARARRRHRPPAARRVRGHRRARSFRPEAGAELRRDRGSRGRRAARRCAATRVHGWPPTSTSGCRSSRQRSSAIADARTAARASSSATACARRCGSSRRASTVDEQRLAQEIAMLADRLDVAEELSRFRAHIAAFRAALGGAAARWRRQAAGVPAAGDAARGQHHREQGQRRGDRRRRAADQGGARADPRAGGEPRVSPFPVILSAPSGGGKTTIARHAAGRGGRTSATRSPARRGRPDRAKSRDVTTISCPARSSSPSGSRERSPSRPRSTGTCTARSGPRSSGCWPAGSTW